MEPTVANISASSVSSSFPNNNLPSKKALLLLLIPFIILFLFSFFFLTISQPVGLEGLAILVIYVYFLLALFAVWVGFTVTVTLKKYWWAALIYLFIIVAMGLCPLFSFSINTFISFFRLFTIGISCVVFTLYLAYAKSLSIGNYKLWRILWILSILILIAIGIITNYISRKNLYDPQIPPRVSTETNTNTNGNTPASSSWQSATDNTLKMSLQYPSGWEFIPNLPGNIDQPFISIHDLKEGRATIIISGNKDDTLESQLQKFRTMHDSLQSPFAEQPIVTDTIKGSEFVSIDKKYSLMEIHTLYYWNNMVIDVFYSGLYSETLKNMYDQILQSIHFIK